MLSNGGEADGRKFCRFVSVADINISTGFRWTDAFRQYSRLLVRPRRRPLQFRDKTSQWQLHASSRLFSTARHAEGNPTGRTFRSVLSVSVRCLLNLPCEYCVCVLHCGKQLNTSVITLEAGCFGWQLGKALWEGIPTGRTFRSVLSVLVQCLPNLPYEFCVYVALWRTTEH